MRQARMTLREINAFDQDEFVARLGFLCEDSSWVAAEAWYARPFANLAGLHRALCDAMYGAPVERQVALIAAHPDLVGKAALAGALTPASIGEQASAGLDRLSPGEIADFTRLNEAYRNRFGFPFVICVREHKKEGILAGFADRLHNPRDREIATALGEIAKICRLRLRDVVETDEPTRP